MADDEITKPGTDILEEGAINMASDRARRINSLHRSVDDIVKEQNKNVFKYLARLVR